MITRVHKGAKFQYVAGPLDETYTATIEDIAILVEGDTVETKVYFSNDHAKSGQELFMMTPQEFHKQLEKINAIQIA